MTEQRDTAELVKWLRLYARGLQISGEPTHGNDEGLNLAADRLETLESRQRVLREALERVLLDVQFMWDDGTLHDRSDDIIYVSARRALAGDAP